MFTGRSAETEDSVTTGGQKLSTTGALNPTSTTDNMLLEVDITNRMNKKISTPVADSSNTMQIAAGDYEYPFTFTLPLSVPSSFVGEYGRIAYSIKAVIDRPWRFDHETVAFFTVVGVYDLNNDSSAGVRYSVISYPVPSSVL